MSDRGEAPEAVEPDFERLQNELEVSEYGIVQYLESIARIAGLVPEEKWNWSFSERTPTTREICEHTFAWLWCDRQQIMVTDRSLHLPTPDPPANPRAMIELLQQEGMEWRSLIRSLSPEILAEEREPWPGEVRVVRSFLFHMLQNVIYKLGQLSLLAFELGLDGSKPYDAPYPNRLYGFASAAPWPSPRES